jgi:hypothetical protein
MNMICEYGVNTLMALVVARIVGALVGLIKIVLFILGAARMP